MIIINHTNHQSNKWAKEQSEGFSKIIDLPFPQIDPRISIEAVEKIAMETMEKIEEIINNEHEVVVVCLQGEYSYCYVLHELLLIRGIRMAVPTTARNVVESGNTKTATFEFAQWRFLS